MNEQEVKSAAERMTRHRGLCGRTIDSFSPYFHPHRHNNFDSRLYYADRNLLADWALSRIAKDETTANDVDASGVVTASASIFAQTCGKCMHWRRSQTCIAIGLGECRNGQGDNNSMSHESYCCPSFHPAYAIPQIVNFNPPGGGDGY